MSPDLPAPPPCSASSPAERLGTVEAQLLQAGTPLWRGDQLAHAPRPGCPTGFAALDAELPGGGWPTCGLVELLLREAGCGEIRLLAPALARLSQPSANAAATPAREVVWVAPPHLPYAPALHMLGIPLARLVCVRADNEPDAAWAAEQVLRSGCAGVVLWWSREPLPASLRRLNLAAHEGGTALFALRPWAHRQQSSPAALRLSLEPAADQHLRVRILKRRGPQLARPLNLALPPLAIPSRAQPAQATPLLPSRAVDVVAGPAPALASA